MAAYGTQRINVREGTKQQICDVARSLFSDRSYLGVSMSDIAARLDITKAALYHHFSGKLEIYQSVLEEVLADLRGQLGPDESRTSPGEQLRCMIRNYLEFGVREKSLINALVMKVSPAESTLREFICLSRDEVVSLFRNAIDEALSCNQPRAPLDSGATASLLVAMMDGLILENALLPKTLDSDVISKELVAMLCPDAGCPTSA